MVVVQIKISQNSWGVEKVRLHDQITGGLPVEVEEHGVVNA